ncbi:MAG TPA: TetR/AcrR family transcriptional regulator [Pseudonocardiaceae bacterium]|jgi:TetR/AcrR family transcriptional repressor of nem operon|nr:TetR/AcrR family transcriptional regulator [Pseudonocardiaceae bacterium]
MDAVDRLLASTRELLWERGYVGTSPKAIQQRSGVGQGSMYHHFAGKSDLALAAIAQSGAELRVSAATLLNKPGSARGRITAYLQREREVLKGCPIGRLTQDPDVLADETLRRPVDETLGWVRGRLAEILAEGKESGEFAADLDPIAVAATLLAVLQGGYVLARAANSTEPYEQAIKGALSLLR